jgi:hypothetical protein
MSDSPKIAEKKIKDIKTAWRTLRPTKKFAGLTVDEFEARTKASADARIEIEKLEKKMTEQIDLRQKADIVSLEWCDKVVKSVVGDVDEGDDGELYEAMGYVRKSERGSGLTRKKKSEPGNESK